MDMLTLEVLAAHEPGKPITRNGKRFLHAGCLAEILRSKPQNYTPPPIFAEFRECTYGLVTGLQCTTCNGFFEQP